jgi:mitochondrial import receptor subunit TOM22
VLLLSILIINCADSTLDSEITDEEDDGDLKETFIDRIVALRDVIPPKQRAALSSTFNTTYSWLRGGLLFGGKSLWVISTSALLLGVPWALAFAEEQQMIEMEKEMKMQQSANDVCGNYSDQMNLSLLTCTRSQLLSSGTTSAISQQLGGQQGARPAL